MESVAKSSLKVTSPTSVCCFAEPIKNDILWHELSPHSLFKQIEDLQWASVESTTKTCPQEAESWTIKTSNDQIKVLWRRLPIHEACIRDPPIRIIEKLIEVHPDCVKSLDNNNRTPLHHAVIHNASRDVVDLLVHAYPDALNIKDFWGKTVNHYAQTSGDGNGINRILWSGTLPESTKPIMEKNPVCIGRLPDTKAIETLEEEIAQAQVESYAAYAQRDEALRRERKLTKKVKELELELSKSVGREAQNLQQIDCLAERNAHMKFLFDRMEKETSYLRHDIDTKTTLLDRVEKENSSLRREDMDNKTALFNRTNLQMNNETELQEVKIKNKMLKNTVAALTDKLKASKGADSTHVQKMDRKISLIEKEKNHLNDLVKELKNEVRTQKETLKVVDERSEQQGTSNELVAQLESEVAILEKIQKRSESRNNELEDILLKKEKRIHNLETNLDLVSVSLRNLSNEVGSKKQEISLLEKEIETLNEEKQLGDDERVGMQERIRELWITMESKKVKSRDANTS